MNIPTRGWVISATGDDACKCGTWKQLWINYASKPWPAACSVVGCLGTATVGVPANHATMEEALIVPMCEACSRRSSAFNLKEHVTVVSSSLQTCD